VPLRRGRMFTQQEWADSGATGRVAVINEYMAQKFWKTPEEALGKRFKFGNANDTFSDANRRNTAMLIACWMSMNFL